MREALVGRQVEIARLGEWLARVHAGHAGAMLLTGEAGIGKTRLLAEAAGLGAASGFRVATASCLPFVTPLPYEPVRALLHGLGCGSPGDIPAESLYTECLRLLERAAGEAPLLLCLDDLQDSDTATRRLVHYCIVRLADLPLAWLLAARPGESLAPFEHHVGRAMAMDRLDLRPLAPPAMSELGTAMMGGQRAGSALLAVVAGRSGGNPFLYVELCRAVVESDCSADEAAAVVPRSVVEAVAIRRRALPEPARRVLEWLALLPEPVTLDELALLERSTEPALERALLALADQRMAEPITESGWRLIHALVRDAVYQTIPAADRRRQHARAADALSNRPAQRRAPQLEAAGRSAEAAECYLQLADEALGRSGGQDAVSLYRRAGDLAGAAGDRALQRVAAGGEVLALLRTGAADDGRLKAERLRAELRAGRDAYRLVFLSRYALALYEDASDLEAAVEAAGEAAPLARRARGTARAEAELAQAFVLTMAGRAASALPHAERGLRAARASGDPVLEVRALGRIGFVTGMARGSGAAIPLLTRAAAAAGDLGLPGEAGRAHLNLSYFADAAGDARAAAAHAGRGLELGPLPPTVEALLRGNLSNALADSGDLDAALAHQLGARAAAARVGRGLEGRILVGLAHIHIMRGELDLAAAALVEVTPVPGSFEYHRALEQRALLLEAGGRLEQALAAYREGAAAANHPSALWCVAGAARVSARLARPSAARQAVRRLDDLGVPWHGGEWLHEEARAFLAAAEGAPGAGELFVTAAGHAPEGFHSTRLRLEAASLCGDRKAVLDSIDTLDRMGARGAADRGRALARGLGMRPGRRRRRLGVLSEREQQVAMLVAAGRTNAEIGAQLYLSPRTVERHVGAILRKVGCRSRVQLAARVATGALPGAPAEAPARIGA